MMHLASALWILAAFSGRPSVDWARDLDAACEKALGQNRLVLLQQVICGCTETPCAVAEGARDPAPLRDEGTRGLVREAFVPARQHVAPGRENDGLFHPAYAPATYRRDASQVRILLVTPTPRRGDALRTAPRHAAVARIPGRHRLVEGRGGDARRGAERGEAGHAMRTVTFSDPKVREFVEKNLLPVWKNIRPDRTFKDGIYEGARGEAVARTTRPGAGDDNICAFVVTPDGKIVHAVQGHVKPEDFLKQLELGLDAARRAADPAMLRELYRARIQEDRLTEDVSRFLVRRALVRLEASPLPLLESVLEASTAGLAGRR
jgi:hypothetical protein